MALYVDEAVVRKVKPQEAFEKIWKPGETPVHAGIYRCQGCDDEIASNKGIQLPTQNHRQHNALQGPIRWKLLVATQQG